MYIIFSKLKKTLVIQQAFRAIFVAISQGLYLKKLKKILSRIFIFLLPPACYGCGSILNEFLFFCYDCDKKIVPVAAHYLQVGQARVPVIAVSNYDYPLKKLILAKNYNHINSAYVLGNIIWEKSVLKNLNFDIIIPIPLHWTRKYWRGYNQTEEIAKAISQLSGKPILKALKRVKMTKYQASLNRTGRGDNLKNAFGIIDVENLANKKILLVDDLMTTGSTFESAIKEIFNKAAAKDIICVVPCRVV